MNILVIFGLDQTSSFRKKDLPDAAAGTFAFHVMLQLPVKCRGSRQHHTVDVHKYTSS